MDAPKLDRYQQHVVSATERSIRVVAPAGSGKTETLVRRVQHQITSGVAPGRILVLTFDKNAQQSFVDKLTRLGITGPVQIRTLNAFGYALLWEIPDEYAEISSAVHFPANGSVIEKLVREYGYPVFTSMISKMKNDIVDLRTITQPTLEAWVTDHREHLLGDLIDSQIMEKVSTRTFARQLAADALAYERALQQRGGIDFDDQKLRALIGLRRSATLQANVQARYDEVIVDEFQDVNRLDCELIEIIARQARLIITGDDDQAIYGFRGASADHLIKPKTQFHRDFVSYELSMNYRCPVTILATADALIRHNRKRIAKHPEAHTTVQGEVELIQASSPQAEVRQVARRLKTLLRPGPYTRAAILTRTNAQKIEIQEALIEEGVPFVSDDIDLRIVWSAAAQLITISAGIASGQRDITDPVVREDIARQFGRARQLTPSKQNRLISLVRQGNWVDSPALSSFLSEKPHREFANGVTAITAGSAPADLIVALTPFLKAEISPYMTEGKSGSTSRSQLDGLRDIVAGLPTDLPTVLEEIEKRLQPQRLAWANPDLPKVELSTCHRAKGREWEVVVVPRCTQGSFPDARATAFPYIEAERKLFYVSMTRASRHLILSRTTATQRGTDVQPSVFLLDAGLIARPKPTTKSARPGARITRLTPETVQNQPVARTVTTASPALSRRRPERTLLLTSSVGGRTRGDGTSPEKLIAIANLAQAWHQRDGLPWHEMTLTSAAGNPESTIALQLLYKLRDIPYTCDERVYLPTSALLDTWLSDWGGDGGFPDGALQADLILAMRQLLRQALGRDEDAWRARLDDLIVNDEGIDPGGIIIR